MPASPRDPTIDILRGFAIAMMVFGHLGIEVLVPPGAFYVEALGGSAPTVFLIVSGMMVMHGIRFRGHGARHYLIRGAQVLGVAAALDVLVWRIVPFLTADILYLIAVSLPIAWLGAAKLSRPALWIVALAIILAAPLLQDLLGYTDYPTEIPLAGEVPEEIRLEGVGPVRVHNPTNALQHWIVDGWFPVFPWAGMALLGAALGFLRWPGDGPPATPSASRSTSPRTRPFGLTRGLIAGALLLVAALALGWWDVDYELTLRRRWGGAFMPPRHDYLLGSIGVTLLLGWLIDRAPSASGWRPLGLLGRHALLVYLMHFAVVKTAGRLLPHRIEHPPFWALYLGVMTVLVLLLLAWDRIRGARRYV